MSPARVKQGKVRYADSPLLERPVSTIAFAVPAGVVFVPIVSSFGSLPPLHCPKMHVVVIPQHPQ